MPTPDAFVSQLTADIAKNPHFVFWQAQISNFWDQNGGLFKAISILLSLAMLSFVVYSAIKIGWWSNRTDRIKDVILRSNMPKKRSLKIWKEVEHHLFTGDDNSLKLAILEADKILDEALRVSGYLGESLGDRLKKIKSEQMPMIEEVWEAHKLRNRIVHEPDFKVNRDLAERALDIYRKTFQDLGLLD